MNVTKHNATHYLHNVNNIKHFILGFICKVEDFLNRTQNFRKIFYFYDEYDLNVHWKLFICKKVYRCYKIIIYKNLSLFQYYEKNEAKINLEFLPCIFQKIWWEMTNDLFKHSSFNTCIKYYKQEHLRATHV